MDASQYTRRLKQSCNKFIARNQCVDASLYTTMQQQRADRVFVSGASDAVNDLVPAACCTASSAFGVGGQDVTPVQPAGGCVSSGICDYMSNRYTTPYISTIGCPFPVTSTATSVCQVTPYCGTPAQLKQAVQRRVDKEMHDCCSSS